ncbi:MAG: hypothetical protein K8L97_13750 [Anaerolineae bacterium]|nr:hypothetical protein [Anaerolineae bacterium]
MFESINKHLRLRAVLIAGIAAGTAFLVFNVLFMPLVLQVSPVVILRYMGSLILGSQVVIQTDVSPVVVGLVVHYLISLLLTLLIAIVVHRWGLVVGVIGGAILGLSLYAINLYTFTLFFQWFFAINNWVLLLSHVVFGAVAGGVYEVFDDYDLPLNRRTNT